MNTKKNITGGARLGGVNATWPFAKLTVTPGQLVLKVVFYGEYVFPSSRVLGLEKYLSLPLVGQGIRIRHDIPEYPEKVIFWSVGNPQKVLDSIAVTGFVAGGDLPSGERG